jgi:hypothetical protein
MNTPKLKRVTVDFGFSCDDGFSKKVLFRTKNEDPKRCLVNAIEEAYRVAVLYGCKDDADKAISSMGERVEKDLSRMKK